MFTLAEEVKQEVQKTEKKKSILSGIQPTGIFTLGNYIGAVRNWQQLQEDYQCAYFIADLHSLTVRQEAAKLRKQSLEAFALLLACGIDPKKSLMFIQSHVHNHAELGWILACNSLFGELSRMTQFKDKSAKHADNINAGLFTYPSLMAADILLYQANLVPVGADQKQHLELTRDIAVRMNGLYPNLFTVPEAYIPKSSARIRSLSEPTRKMSKSDAEDSYIALLDAPDVIRRKFRRAVTDSETEIRYDPENKPGVSNLLSILSAMENVTPEEEEARLKGCNYGALKEAASEAVIAALSPIQERYQALMGDKEYIQNTLKNGAERAHYLAQKTLRKVYRKVGLYQI